MKPCYGVYRGKRVGSRHRWNGRVICDFCGRFRDELIEKRPPSINTWLSRRAFNLVKRIKADADGEVTVEGRVAYVGCHRVNINAVHDLLDLCLLRQDHRSGNYAVYTLYPEVDRVLADVFYEPAIITARRTGQPVVR